MKMRKIQVVFWMIVLFATPLFAREKSDVLVMRNGDHLTCEIKRLSADVLYIGLGYALGTVSIIGSKWITSRVNSFLSSKLRMARSILEDSPCRTPRVNGRFRST